ncbi:MAG: lysine--tRNA ligase [Patescibacteria group bacterium]|jgi:lysyl-tRNA synthetase class 2
MPVPNEHDIRREKRQALLDQGIRPYPSRATRTATCAEALASFDDWAADARSVTLVGRLLTTRVHGALIFADLKDASERLQILLKQDVIGDELFARFRDRIDPADFVQVTGTLFATKRGEKTLQVADWTLLSKALLPLPEKWHGLADQETRYRFRELDLVSNEETRRLFMLRTATIRALRHALEEEGFAEVETPMLQPIAGGASARPFVTHHNALDIDLYLRIAPELYLKRLIVGGYEKVFEIGRQFRNEGIDWSHNPEFTSLEFYWAYQDYNGLMDFTEALISRVVTEVNGSLEIAHGEGKIDMSGPWPRKTFRAAIKEACGIDIVDTSRADLVTAMKKLNIQSDYEKGDLGKLYDDLYKDTVRSRQIEPLYIIDYPIEMEPLAKKCDDDPRFVQRFQLIVGTVELLKAYSELNDPTDQLERFHAQQELRDSGDDEAQQIDMAFITSLEHGMPPTAGWGMGVDRFVALLGNVRSLKEVILFPTLRPPESESNS